MTIEKSKKLQEKEFKFLDTKDLRPLLVEGKTIDTIAGTISDLFDDEYIGEKHALSSISTDELAEYLENRYGVKFVEKVELALQGKIPNKNQFRRRIRFICGDMEYSYTEDFTEYLETLVQCNNEYTDTHEPMTMNNCYRYIEPCVVKVNELDKYNGVHAVYGIFEDFSQSSIGNTLLYYCGTDDELKIIFERI